MATAFAASSLFYVVFAQILILIRMLLDSLYGRKTAKKSKITQNQLTSDSSNGRKSEADEQ